MVRVIMGAKGTGKTKQMINLINEAAVSESGSVICIEAGSKLKFDVSKEVRLVSAQEFAANDFTFLKGFVSGIYASNYDITHVFLDSLCKIVPSEPNEPAVDDFVNWLAEFAQKNSVKFTITISADASLASDAMKAYF